MTEPFYLKRFNSLFLKMIIFATTLIKYGSRQKKLCPYILIFKMYYFNQIKLKMATAIKAIPVLKGEEAERFVKEAEKNSKKPTPKLTAERKARLNMVLKLMNDFQL